MITDFNNKLISVYCIQVTSEHGALKVHLCVISSGKLTEQ